MTRPIIHARDHAHGGADPLLLPYEDIDGGGGTGGDGGGTTTPSELARGRIWTTYGGFDPYTISDTHAEVIKFNKGAVTDEEVFSVEFEGGSGSLSTDMMRLRIWKGGVYAITFRLNPDSYGGGASSWEGTRLSYQLYDPAPDMWDGFHDTIDEDGFAAVVSYVTTIQDSTDWLPYSLYIQAAVPDGSRSVTFGRSDWKTSHPTRNTASYLEAVRLGAADTSDWLYWDETPDDVGGPTTPPTLSLAAPALSAAPSSGTGVRRGRERE